MPAVGMGPIKPPALVDPATGAWLNAVLAAGGTVSPARQVLVNNLITGLKTNGLFAIPDAVWLLAGENQQQANIDIINRRTWTFNGSNTFATGFVPNQGWTGDGSTNYLDTGIDLSSFSGSYSQNSCSAFGYVGTTPNVNGSLIQCQVSGVSRFGYLPWNGGLASSWLNETGSVQFASQNTGNHLGSRTGATAMAIYLNEVQQNTDNLASAAFTPGVTLVIGANKISTPSITNFASYQIRMVGFGGGFSAVQAPIFQNLINAFMGAIGANVY